LRIGKVIFSVAENAQDQRKDQCKNRHIHNDRE
jgi:hypothetical protein